MVWQRKDTSNSSKIASFQIVFESDHFLWCPFSSGDVDDVDWDNAFEDLYEEIKRQFSSLHDVDDEYIQLQDDDECDVADGEELQNLFEDADSDEIIINVILEEMNNLNADSGISEVLSLNHSADVASVWCVC